MRYIKKKKYFFIFEKRTNSYGYYYNQLEEVVKKLSFSTSSPLKNKNFLHACILKPVEINGYFYQDAKYCFAKKSSLMARRVSNKDEPEKHSQKSMQSNLMYFGPID